MGTIIIAMLHIPLDETSIHTRPEETFPQRTGGYMSVYIMIDSDEKPTGGLEKA